MITEKQTGTLNIKQQQKQHHVIYVKQHTKNKQKTQGHINILNINFLFSYRKLVNEYVDTKVAS